MVASKQQGVTRTVYTGGFRARPSVLGLLLGGLQEGKASDAAAAQSSSLQVAPVTETHNGLEDRYSGPGSRALRLLLFQKPRGKYNRFLKPSEKTASFKWK